MYLSGLGVAGARAGELIGQCDDEMRGSVAGVG